MSTVPTKFCYACGQSIDSRAEICPHCGVRQPLPATAGYAETSSNRIAAGLCGILLGSLGVHKFILGFTVPGITLLLVTLLTCGFGAIVTSVIGLIEGIIYLSKSDEQFYQDYVVGQREWF